MEHTTKLTVDLLAQGYSAHEVAVIRSCQLAEVLSIEVEHQAVIADLKMESAIARKSIDVDLDELESTLVQRMQKIAPFVSDIRQLAQSFQIVNSAKRGTPKERAAQNQQVANVQVIQITLPERLASASRITKDSHNRVIEVGGRSTLPASEKLVQEELQTMFAPPPKEEVVPDIVIGKSGAATYTQEMGTMLQKIRAQRDAEFNAPKSQSMQAALDDLDVDDFTQLEVL